MAALAPELLAEVAVVETAPPPAGDVGWVTPSRRRSMDRGCGGCGREGCGRGTPACGTHQHRETAQACVDA